MRVASVSIFLISFATLPLSAHAQADAGTEQSTGTLVESDDTNTRDELSNALEAARAAAEAGPADPDALLKALHAERFLATSGAVDPDEAVLSARRLTQATASGADALLELLGDDRYYVPLGTPEVNAAIDILTEYVNPLPSSRAGDNWRAYAALVRLDPDNNAYAEKSDRYRSAFFAPRYSSLARLRQQTDEFSEITYYAHPNTPRSRDERSYLDVYLGEHNGQVFMRMRLNYTADSWLFIDSAQAKIDGDYVDLNFTDWKRDNGSDVWEWVDIIMDDRLREIAKRISVSSETVIRLNGQQYYDNMTVRAVDKKAITEMFAAEAVLKERVARN